MKKLLQVKLMLGECLKTLIAQKLRNLSKIEDKKSRKTRQIEICILGVYGKGNLGDEAILKAVIQDITKKLSRAKIVVFCSNPDMVSRWHRVDAMTRTPFVQFFKKLGVIYRADVLVLGGGTMLCDDLNWKNDISASAAIMIWPVIASVFGVPMMVYGQGIGPAEHRITRFAIRLLMCFSDVITLRDMQSMTLASKFGRRRTPLKTTCDPVVTSAYFQPDQIRLHIKNSIAESIQSIYPYTLISLRRPKRGPLRSWISFYEAFAKAIGHFYRETKSRLVLLPIQISDVYPDDREVLPVIRAAMLREGVDERALLDRHWNNIEEAVAILQSADLVIASRLHALLIAARAGVAVLGISYEDKVSGCLEMIGINSSCNYVSQVDFDVEVASSAMIAAWEKRTKHRDQILAGVAKWAASTPSNIDVLLKTLA